MQFQSIVAGAISALAVLSSAHAAESFSGTVTSHGHVANKSVYTLSLTGASLFDVFGGKDFNGAVTPALGHAGVAIDLSSTALNLQGIKLVSLASPTTFYSHNLSGNFAFTGLAAGDYDLQLTYTLPANKPLGTYSGLITMTAAAVPEPQSMALVLAGLGVVGFLGRRRATRA